MKMDGYFKYMGRLIATKMMKSRSKSSLLRLKSCLRGNAEGQMLRRITMVIPYLPRLKHLL
jgi:hypothetical protein